MRVKQLLGNDVSWLLLKFSDRILNRLQTTSGTVVIGVLVMVSSESSDPHRDSSWVILWLSCDEVDWLNWAPEQSTINFVNTSWPSRGEQLHWAGQKDWRAAITSTFVHLTSPELVLVGVRLAFWIASVMSCTQNITAKIIRTQLITFPFVVSASTDEYQFNLKMLINVIYFLFICH